MPRPTAHRKGKDDTLAHRAVPEVIGWETTLACNMRCRHCGSTAGAARGYELNAEEAQELCRQIVELRVPRVCLTGGETLMRRDWKSIVGTLLEGDVEIGLLTNGWTLVGKTLRELGGYRDVPFYLSVSLDGTPEIHDHIRALPGSFDRAFRGAMELKAMGVPVAVITTINHANLGCLPRLRELLFEELKPYCWQLQTANLFGRAKENDDDCRVSPVEYAQAVCFTAETRRLAKETGIAIYAGDCMGYLASLEPRLRDTPWTGCQAGLELIGIQSNGNVKGCLSIIDDRFIEGNALTDGIEAIWNRRGAFSYTRGFRPGMLHGTCAGCPVGDQCRGGCTAAAVSSNGGPHDAPYCLRAVEEAAPPLKRAKPTKRKVQPRREPRP
ncbi:MAG: radical SAM protein [Myxococcaceae bacterium]